MKSCFFKRDFMSVTQHLGVTLKYWKDHFSSYFYMLWASCGYDKNLIFWCFSSLFCSCICWLKYTTCQAIVAASLKIKKKKNNNKIKYLRSSQMVYGSPTYPLLHIQSARWLLAVHCALSPHVVVKQGSWHFSWIHARLIGHSGSEVHSGLAAKWKKHAFNGGSHILQRLMRVGRSFIEPFYHLPLGEVNKESSDL